MPCVISGRCGMGKSHMLEGMRRQKAPPRGAVEKPDLQEIGLDNILNRIARFRKRGGNRIDAHRPAAEIDGNAVQVAMVQRIKPALVHIEIAQRPVRRPCIDARIARDGGKIPHPAQQPARQCAACRANAWQFRARHLR